MLTYGVHSGAGVFGRLRAPGSGPRARPGALESPGEPWGALGEPWEAQGSPGEPWGAPGSPPGSLGEPAIGARSLIFLHMVAWLAVIGCRCRKR